MPEAYIVDAVRTPVGRRGGGLSQVHPADLGAHALSELIDAHRHRPGGGRGRRLRLRRRDRSAGRRHRPHVLARGRAPRGGPGHDDRPAVRLEPAGGALRRAGRDERHERRDRRRRRAEHEHDPDLLGDDRRRAVRLHRPVQHEHRLGRALRHPGGEPVPRRGDDRREVGRHPRGDGGVRGRVARARAAGAGRGSLRARDRAARRGHARRRAARAELGEDPVAQAARRGWTAHRRGQHADLRRAAAMLVVSERAVASTA